MKRSRPFCITILLSTCLLVLVSTACKKSPTAATQPATTSTPVITAIRTAATLADQPPALPETPSPATPSESPTGQAFIPHALAVISPENISQLEVVATLEVPGTYWTVFSPDSQRLATIQQRPQDREWQIEVWDLAQGASLYTVPGGPTAFFSEDGMLAAMANGRGFTIYDSMRGKVQDALEYPGAIALAPDLSLLVTTRTDAGSSGSEIISVIESSTGVSVYEFSVDGVVVAARFSPDGSILAITTGGITSEATLWEMATGDLLATLEEVDRLVFSPDGDLIAGLFGPMKEIRILDSSGFAPRMILDNSPGPQAQELAFSSDGRLLAAGLGNKVRIWDVQSGEQGAAIEVQAANIAFAPNGRLLVTSNFQGEVLFWAVRP